MHRVWDELPVAKPARVHPSPADQILVALQLRRERHYAAPTDFERQANGLSGGARNVRRDFQDRGFQD